MVQMSLSIKGDKELHDTIMRVIGIGANMRNVLARCVPILRRSINQNFVKGGRPDPWAPRWKAIETLFPNSKGKNVLRVSGMLRQSSVQNAEVILTKDKLIYANRLDYAVVQQFGGESRIKVPEGKIRTTKDGKPYVCLHGENGWYAKKLDSDGTFTIKVRPRPFFMIQPEDRVAILGVFQKTYSQAMARK